MPFKLMPKSVKKSIPSGKSSKWMKVYDAVRNQGKSKEMAAKIAHSVIKKESENKLCISPEFGQEVIERWLEEEIDKK